MAIFHLSIQVISRGKGRSAVAAAAYCAGERITNEYDNYTHDYTRKKGIVDTQIFLPDHAPAEYSDRSTLWNAVEKIEGNSNSQLAREIEFSLPIELSMEQNIALVHEYVKKHFVAHGMIADVTIHDNRTGNPHCHVMLTMRPLNTNLIKSKAKAISGNDKVIDDKADMDIIKGKDESPSINEIWGAKSRKEYILDDNSERIRLPNKKSKSGNEILGEYKSRKVYTVDWNDKDKAEVWRKGWADILNEHLEKYGHAEKAVLSPDGKPLTTSNGELITISNKVDHRSYERQGNGIIPTIHLGVAAHQMEQKGIRTEKGDYNRRVQSLNSEMKQSKARIRKLKNWLYKQPIHNAPSLMDIMGGVAKGKNLKNDWQRVRSLQTQAKVLIFLQENNINSIEDFADTVISKNERLKIVTDDIKKAERRLETLAVHLTHAENNRQHKAVYQKYKSLAPKTDPAALNSLNPFTKSKATKEHDAAAKKQDVYYEKHADEIQAYQAAQDHFTAVMNGRTTLPIADWQKEQKELAAKRYKLCDEFYLLKEEIPNMEAIRRSVETIIRDEPNKVQPTHNRDVAL